MTAIKTNAFATYRFHCLFLWYRSKWSRLPKFCVVYKWCKSPNFTKNGFYGPFHRKCQKIKWKSVKNKMDSIWAYKTRGISLESSSNNSIPGTVCTVLVGEKPFLYCMWSGIPLPSIDLKSFFGLTLWEIFQITPNLVPSCLFWSHSFYIIGSPWSAFSTCVWCLIPWSQRRGWNACTFCTGRWTKMLSSKLICSESLADEVSKC